MNQNRRGIVVIVTVLLASAVFGWIYGPAVRATSGTAEDTQSAVREFTTVLDVVQANYAEPVDVDKEVYSGAIPGMLRVLDPHSNFFDARQYALLREDQRGKYYGVGMIVAPRENHTVVMAPYVGAPAYNAGLRPGDVIVRVDEKPTDGLSTTEVADMCATDAAQYERSRPGAPAILFHTVLVAEVGMKLIKNHALTGGVGRDVLRVDIGVLPCPANFDQVIFIKEAHTERSSVARARVQYDARVRPCDMIS